MMRIDSAELAGVLGTPPFYGCYPKAQGNIT